MPWYAIRTVYLFGTKQDGTNVFEERIVCFDAQTWPEAHARAEVEAEEYAARMVFAPILSNMDTSRTAPPW